MSASGDATNGGMSSSAIKSATQQTSRLLCSDC